MSPLGQWVPRLPALTPPDVRYAAVSDQDFPAPRLVGKGEKETSGTAAINALFDHLVGEREQIR